MDRVFKCKTYFHSHFCHSQIYFNLIFIFVPYRGQDASREHSYPIQSCSHSDHWPGSEHNRRGRTCSTRTQTSGSENTAPGGAGGSEQARLGSLWFTMGYSRSTVLHGRQCKDPCWGPAPSGSSIQFKIICIALFTIQSLQSRCTGN